MGRAARVLALAAASLSMLGASPAASADPDTATTLVPVNLGPIHIGAPGVDAEGAELAFDGSNFLVVWHAGATVYGALVSPQGTVVAPGIVTLSTTGYDPSVAFDGTNFFVVWAAGNEEVHGVRVTTGGIVLDTTPIVVGHDTKQRPTPVAFDGTNYIVVWRTLADAVQAARVSPAGVPQPEFNVGGGFYPQVACAGAECLVAWHQHGTALDVYGRLVHANGSLSAAFPVSAEAADQHHVSVASDGSGYLALWQDARAGNQENFSGAYAARIAANGTVLDDPAIVVSKYHWSQGSRPSAAFDGTDYVAAWSQYHFPVDHRLSDIYLRRIASAGGFMDAEPVPVATGFFHQVEPVVGAAGNRYVITLNDYGPPCPYPSACVAIGLLDRVAAGPAGPVPADLPPVASTWERLPSPIDAPIHSVWAFGNGSAFAGTDPDGGAPPWDQNPLLEWDGTAWSIATMLPNARKFGIWGTGPTRVFTIGGVGNMVLWDGSTATVGGGLFNSTGPLTPLGTSIWGFGEWNIFMAGVDGVTARHFGTDFGTWHGPACLSWDDGSGAYWGKWVCERIRGSLDNWDVWGAAPNDVFVVGELGTLAHFDGTKWTLVPVPTRQSLNGVWGTCSGDVFAVGDYGTILRYDGSTWTEQQSPTTENLYAVAGFDGSHVYAVGNTGAIVSYDGASWTREAGGTDNTLEDVAVGESVVWVVGSGGTILRKQLAIFDTSAPENPVLASQSHPAGTWKSNSTVEVSIAGGCDDGRGIGGFSTAFDNSPTTVPDAVEDLDEGTVKDSETLGHGEWYFHLRTVDRAGNWGGEAVHAGPFLVDTTPPSEGALTSPSHTVGKPSIDSVVNIHWHDASDAGSGIAEYSFLWDNAPATVPDTDAEVDDSDRGRSTRLGDGTWYFHLRTKDKVGNWSGGSHIGPFVIDTRAPTPAIPTSPSHPIFTPSADNTVEIALAGAADEFSGVDGFSYVWDQCPDCDPPKTKQLEETATRLTSPPLADGDWWFHVKTVDNAGNWSGMQPVGPFRIDTVAPQTTIDLGPMGATNDSTPTFGFSANEPGVSFGCRVDASVFAACTSPHTTAALADGARSLEVRATDGAGNTDASPASRLFTVDTVAPQTSIDAGPEGPTSDLTPTFAFSASEPGAGFECRLGGAGFAACTSPYTTASLGNGAHSFDVRARDQLGNVDATPASRSFTVGTLVRRAVVGLASQSVAVTRTGIAAVRLGCGSQAACAGVLRLEATVDGKRRKLELGRRSFSIPAGRASTVKVKLSRRGLAIVRRLGRLRARAVIVTRQQGRGKTTVSRAITLKARR